MAFHAPRTTSLMLAGLMMAASSASMAATDKHHHGHHQAAHAHQQADGQTVHSAVIPAQITYDDPAFKQLISPKAQLTRLYNKATWSEGPIAMPDGSVIWSDVKQNEVLRWQPTGKHAGKVSTWLKPSDFQNGHAVDEQGRIVAASHGKRGIVRQEGNEWKVLVDKYEGKQLNSPNDLIIDSTGAIWFTDPTFGVNNTQESYGGTVEQDGEYVYRFLPATGVLERLETPLVKAPNGLALSPDERTLYVADSQLAHDFNDHALAHQIIAYDISLADRKLSNGRVFAVINPGIPDGMKVDVNGNVWTSSGDSVQVYSPEGKRLGRVTFPSIVGNMVFGMNKAGKPVLYVTASSGLYRLDVNVKGAVPVKR